MVYRFIVRLIAIIFVPLSAIALFFDQYIGARNVLIFGAVVYTCFALCAFKQVGRLCWMLLTLYFFSSRVVDLVSNWGNQRYWIPLRDQPIKGIGDVYSILLSYPDVWILMLIGGYLLLPPVRKQFHGPP